MLLTTTYVGLVCRSNGDARRTKVNSPGAYKLRDGSRVEVTHVGAECLRGILDGFPDNSIRWRMDGRLFKNVESQYDIIGPWTYAHRKTIDVNPG